MLLSLESSSGFSLAKQEYIHELQSKFCKEITSKHPVLEVRQMFIFETVLLGKSRLTATVSAPMVLTLVLALA